MDFKQAINNIKNNVKDKNALAYVNAIPKVIDEDGKHGLYTQVLYILENIKTWRGTDAQDTKSFLRDWIKKNETH